MQRPFGLRFFVIGLPIVLVSALVSANSASAQGVSAQGRRTQSRVAREYRPEYRPEYQPGAATDSPSSADGSSPTPVTPYSNGLPVGIPETTGGIYGEPLQRYDAPYPWMHGYVQEIPAYEGYAAFRPYNYKHVFAQSQAAGGWGMSPTMPYAQQFWHRYRKRALMTPDPSYSRHQFRRNPNALTAPRYAAPASSRQYPSNRSRHTLRIQPARARR